MDPLDAMLARLDPQPQYPSGRSPWMRTNSTRGRDYPTPTEQARTVNGQRGRWERCDPACCRKSFVNPHRRWISAEQCQGSAKALLGCGVALAAVVLLLTAIVIGITMATGQLGSG